MLRAVSPVPLPALLDLYTVDGTAKPLHVKAAILQGARSESVGWYELGDGSVPDRLLAAALLYPLGAEPGADDVRELVFACRPEISRHLAAVIRTARLSRARMPEGVRIRATVRAGHVPGRRLALLCGLAFAGEAGGFERYEVCT